MCAMSSIAAQRSSGWEKGCHVTREKGERASDSSYVPSAACMFGTMGWALCFIQLLQVAGVPTTSGEEVIAMVCHLSTSRSDAGWGKRKSCRESDVFAGRREGEGEDKHTSCADSCTVISSLPSPGNRVSIYITQLPLANTGGQQVTPLHLRK